MVKFSGHVFFPRMACVSRNMNQLFLYVVASYNDTESNKRNEAPSNRHMTHTHIYICIYIYIFFIYMYIHIYIYDT